VDRLGHLDLVDLEGRCSSHAVDLVQFLAKCLADPATALASALCMCVLEWEVHLAWDREDRCHPL